MLLFAGAAKNAFLLSLETNRDRDGEGHLQNQTGSAGKGMGPAGLGSFRARTFLRLCAIREFDVTMLHTGTSGCTRRPAASNYARLRSSAFPPSLVPVLPSVPSFSPPPRAPPQSPSASSPGKRPFVAHPGRSMAWVAPAGTGGGPPSPIRRCIGKLRWPPMSPSIAMTPSPGPASGPRRAQQRPIVDRQRLKATSQRRRSTCPAPGLRLQLQRRVFVATRNISRPHWVSALK